MALAAPVTVSHFRVWGPTAALAGSFLILLFTTPA